TSQATPAASQQPSHREQLEKSPVLTEIPCLRSPSSGHQIGRVRFQQVFGSLFRQLPASFWGRSQNKSGSK
ncbi:unnamed protein product, partial [Prunus brigantina]